ncbi:MAG: phosphatidate cytidylyltransferase [Actinomycetota bacterium]|nr:phosphatidate cytidylyltransferase [Actinomycetota bacterium]
MTSDRRDAAAGTPAPARSISRAGRDLPTAIVVGAVLLVVIAASLFVVKAAFVVLVLAAISLAVWELKAALATRGVVLPVWSVLAGGVAMPLGAYLGGADAMVVAAALTVLLIGLLRMASGSTGYVRDVTAGVFTAAYVPFLACFVLLMLRPDDGPSRVVTFILVTIASDIGGYATGALFGRHPMAPKVSPKKSWEGFAGSAVSCALVGWATVVYLLDGPWWAGVLLGLAAVVSATLGDLAESMMKRDLGIKDMGTLLPGHGGLMDRLDSLLATVPVAWMILYWLVP